MHTMNGPRQIDGARRVLGFASVRERDEARRMVRRDPAAWDALRPVAIIDCGAGRWWPVRGSNEDCAALAAASRGEP